MGDQAIKVGCNVSFAKTVSESDIYLFAGITGDLSPNHVNREYMKQTSYGRRIAHGALLVGYMSTASSLFLQQFPGTEDDSTPVSLGYDNVRFIKPVFINDTITVTYTVEEIDSERNRSLSSVVIVNQNNETVAVAKHILKWVANC